MDEQDAPPTRVGQAVTPKAVVAGGIGPDGNFFLDVPDDEMLGRGLMNMLMHELDRYYTNRRMSKMLKDAADRQSIERMLVDPKMRRLK